MNFIQVTPEYEKQLEELVKNLKGPVNDLNKRLPEFPKLVDQGFVRFSMKDLESMPSDYNTDYHEWITNGAIHDFTVKMSQTYKHFDEGAHDEFGGDPKKYVSTKSRKVTLGNFGSIWTDLPLSGTVKGKTVTKWTRAAFEFSGSYWIVHFDPTGDSCSFNDRESEEYVKLMTGADRVDLSA